MKLQAILKVESWVLGTFLFVKGFNGLTDALSKLDSGEVKI